MKSSDVLRPVIRGRRIVEFLAVRSGGAMSALGSRVVTVIAASLGLKRHEVRRTAAFATDLGVDSLDFVEMVMALEHEFSIVIDDMVAERIGTVDDAVGYVEDLVAHRMRRAAAAV